MLPELHLIGLIVIFKYLSYRLQITNHIAPYCKEIGALFVTMENPSISWPLTLK